ncbi:MAG: site-2 protease family protein [Chloroflexi bacterium]|nr:site-2 protease family protein [Chloroflexota bacterium]
MLNTPVPVLISRIVVLIVAFTVHEFAHAWTANYFGDDTPRLQGRLTLNPLVHLDFLGSLLLLVAGFGWAKPVQVNPYALEQRSPSAPMLVALAGPASNFMLALLAAAPVQAGFLTPTLSASGFLPSLGLLISEFVSINLLLMLFNLIPVFPLDGEKVLTYFLPESGKNFMAMLRPYGQFILIALIFLVPGVLQFLIGGPIQALYGLLLG